MDETIGAIEEAGSAGTRLLTVPVRDIAVSLDNTRLFEKGDKDQKEALKGLAASIAEIGLQQPPKVRAATTEDKAAVPWVLVYGEQRLRAVRDILKWTHITVVVDRGLDRTTATEATVVENLQRRDLHPMDEARGIALLRVQGKTAKEIAKRLGRSEGWIEDRLKLCDLPAAVQDLYRRSRRLTVGAMLALHDYTHGGRDNTGFPALIAALAGDMEAGINPNGYLGGVANSAEHGPLVQRVFHAYNNIQGTWGGNYFDTKDICRRCPFAAYRPGTYEGEGFCLMPAHYRDLQDKGKEKQEKEQAERAKGAPAPVVTARPTYQAPPVQSAAQKGKETRKRHQRQKSDYVPTVRAVERVIDMIPAVDAIDLAVLCAYTLSTRNVDGDAIKEVTARHGLSGFPGTEPTPTARQIDRLRELTSVDLLRYTLEALLLTQARRARDYDPGKNHADPVLGLYVGSQAPVPAAAVTSAPASPPSGEDAMDHDAHDAA